MTIQQGLSSSTFITNINYALIKAAIAIMNENTQTVNHAERVAFSKRILGNTRNADQSIVLGVLSNATILATATPESVLLSDIEFQVNSMFDSFALATV